MTWRRLKALRLSAFLLVAALSPGGLATADSFDSYTSLSESFLVQSFSVSRHFFEATSDERNVWLRSRERDDEDEPVHRRLRALEPIPTRFRWTLGYTVTKATDTVAPFDATYSHSISGGLGWELLANHDLSMTITGETTPRDNLRGGGLEFAYSYMMLLDKEDDEAETEEERISRLREEELTPYRQRLLKRMAGPSDLTGRLEPEQEEEPYQGAILNFGLKWAAAVQSKQPAGAIVTTQSFVVPPPLIVKQFSWALEVAYTPVSQWSYRGSFNYYWYNRDIDSFVSALTNASGRRLLQLSMTQLGAFSNSLLGFQDWSATLGASFAFWEIWLLDLSVNRTFYASAATSPTLGLNAGVYRWFGDKWRLGLGGDLQSGIGFTTLTGYLTVSRLL